MKILAFLQNQWFKDPERAKLILETRYKGNREKFIRTFLFYNCLTGKRLESSLGGVLCDHIIWEECSTTMAKHSRAAFPADIQHMASVIKKHNPDLVIAYGRIAVNGLEKIKRIYGGNWLLYKAPHPTSRGPNLLAELKQVKEFIDEHRQTKAGSHV